MDALICLKHKIIRIQNDICSEIVFKYFMEYCLFILSVCLDEYGRDFPKSMFIAEKYFYFANIFKLENIFACCISMGNISL